MKQTSKAKKTPTAGRARKGTTSTKAGAAEAHGGFHKGKDKLATIAELLNPRVPTRFMGELSLAEQVRLISARLRRERHFVPLHVLGVEGIIDRKRALREIRALSRLGLHLLEIEKEYLKIEIEREVRR